MSFFKSKSLIFAVFLVASGTSSLAQVESGELRLAISEDAFSESYTPLTKVSGYTLVGLRYGSGLATFNPDQVELSLKGLETAEKFVCAKTISRDGQYWNENPYNLPSLISEKSKFKTISVRFKRELGRYRGSDLYILASTTEKPNCHETQSLVFLPVVNGKDEKDRLSVVLNTQGRQASVRLRSSLGETVGNTRCTMITHGSRVAADKICTFTLPKGLATGTYDLELRMRSRLIKSQPEFFKVHLNAN